MSKKKKAAYSATVYLVENEEGMFLHRVRHDTYLWRKDIRPYTVCQYKHLESTLRAIRRIGLGGKPIQAILSFRPLLIPDSH